MKILNQEKFEEPKNLQDCQDEPLVIHQHNKQPLKCLIIFVHGLGGKRYGKNATWGQFPSFIYNDFSDIADVGLYSYKTLFHRLFFKKSLKFEDEAGIIADRIRECKYENILLIGHSLGGVLCMATIVELLDTPEISKISGLILRAAPQLGSLKVPSFIGCLTEDFKVLKPHSTIIYNIQRIFTDRINIQKGLVDLKRISMPIGAVIAAYDSWVDKLSAECHLPRNQICHVRETHTEIVKPKDKETDAYRFVSKWIVDCFNQNSKTSSVTEPESTETQFFPQSFNININTCNNNTCL